MKRIFVYLSLVFVIFCSPVLAQNSQEAPVTLTKTENGYIYEKVVELPSVTKDQAYARVKKWVTTNLKTMDNNIAFDDAEKSNIATSAAMLMKMRQGVLYTVGFKISFSFKENKMKINASQFILSVPGNDPTPFSEKIRFLGKGGTLNMYEKFDIDFGGMINAVTEAAKKDDNW